MHADYLPPHICRTLVLEPIWLKRVHLKLVRLGDDKVLRRWVGRETAFQGVCYGGRGMESADDSHRGFDDAGTTCKAGITTAALEG